MRGDGAAGCPAVRARPRRSGRGPAVEQGSELVRELLPPLGTVLPASLGHGLFRGLPRRADLSLDLPGGHPHDRPAQPLGDGVRRPGVVLLRPGDQDVAAVVHAAAEHGQRVHRPGRVVGVGGHADERSGTPAEKDAHGPAEQPDQRADDAADRRGAAGAGFVALGHGQGAVLRALQDCRPAHRRQLLDLGEGLVGAGGAGEAEEHDLGVPGHGGLLARLRVGRARLRGPAEFRRQEKSPRTHSGPYASASPRGSVKMSDAAAEERLSAEAGATERQLQVPGSD